jgi:hypothetical protein
MFDRRLLLPPDLRTRNKSQPNAQIWRPKSALGGASVEIENRKK